MSVGNTRQRFPVAEFSDQYQYWLVGSFQSNDTNPPTLVRGQGIISVSRTSAGRFLVTIATPSPAQLIAGTAQVDLAAAPGSGTACLATVRAATWSQNAATFEVATYSASTSATAGVIDDPPNTERVSFHVCFQSRNKLVQP